MTKEEIIKELGKESTAPDRETPDWMLADIRRGFEAGEKYRESSLSEHGKMIEDVVSGMEEIGGIPSNKEYVEEFIGRVYAVFEVEPEANDYQYELIAELGDALETAKETIKAWHGPDDTTWELYDKHSPEMKCINEAIIKLQKYLKNKNHE